MIEIILSIIFLILTIVSTILILKPLLGKNEK
ncbi:MAG: hypothetical protein Ct9H90mP2_09240 [Dehalococcoidia bacterium]|jgi:hypothetical protein|nr:MAG: hypothetical protein Ct9H90mP2_09240 [Dehalococcoidia bacterium]